MEQAIIKDNKSKFVLVTGAGGFVGQHLIKELRGQGLSVVGVGLRPDTDSATRELLVDYIGDCDLTNANMVARLPLAKTSAIINLAGLAQVGASFGKQELYNKTNIRVHTTLADRILKEHLPIRMISVSSGAVYESNQTMPLTEDSKLATSGSPYALSKIAMERALRPYQDKGLDIVIARPFNHIGPGQSEGFLVPDLVKQLNTKDVLKVGNIASKRDYTDVRDIARAYYLLIVAKNLNHNVYNICSNKSISGALIIKELGSLLGKPNVKTHIDSSKIRPTDPLEIYGDYSRIKNDTGWHPKIPLRQTLKNILES